MFVLRMAVLGLTYENSDATICLTAHAARMDDIFDLEVYAPRYSFSDIEFHCCLNLWKDEKNIASALSALAFKKRLLRAKIS